MSSLYDGICLVQLKDLGTWFGGGTPSKRQPAYWENGTIPWVSPKDMKVERIRGAEDSITEKAVKESTTNLLPSGAVLAVTRSGILRHTFPVAVTEVPVTINQDLKALIPKTEVDPNYVAFALRAFSREILNQCSKQGTTVNSIETKELLRFRIPLFPYEQQKCIVAEIEKQFSRLDEAVANLKRVKANLKRYKAVVLKSAVEGKLTEEWRKQHPDVEPADKLLERILAERREKWTGKGKYKEPVAPDTSKLPVLPEGWVWVSVDAVTNNFDGDRIPVRAADRDKRSGPYPYYGASGIIDDIDDFIFDGNYLLIAEDGANLLSRSTPIAFKASGKFWVNNHAHIVQLRAGIPLEYLELYLSSISLAPYVTGSAQPKLTQASLNKISMPLPSLSEQHQIVAEVERRLSIVAGAEAQVDANLRRADRLCQSVLKQAFSGQLVPQDPNDEPASVLLKWMREQQTSPEKVSKEKHSPRRRTRPVAKPDSDTGTLALASLDSVIDAILRFMQPDKEYSRAEITDFLGLTTGRWNAAIQELKRRGKVRQLGARRGARYLKT